MDKKTTQTRLFIESKIPIIAIVGRPNVGKSTLFNRIIGKRKSIIDPTPGVTRDQIIEDVFLEERKIRIMDTGGLIDDKDEMNVSIQKKSFESISQADLIVFMVEINNPLPIEAEYIDFIRKLNKKTILAVNKCDSKEREKTLFEYYSYGLGEPIPISSAHNINIDILIEKILENFPKIEDENETDIDCRPETNTEEKGINIAIIGKPNVGKSSLLNRIVGKERSIVSSIAGTTRDVVTEQIVYNNCILNILDTAGIRKKSKVNIDVEYYSVNRAIKAIENADVTILIIDSLEEVSDQDKKITDQVVKNGKGLIIALNKWDLQENQGDIKDKKEMLLFKFPMIKYAPIIPISAKTGFGINKLLAQSIEIYKQINKRIDTPKLNDFINEVIKKYSPSTKKGVLKIYYGAQTSVAPIEFVFFINKNSLLTESYKNYVVNRFREKFGFTGIPIKVLFKDKKR